MRNKYTKIVGLLFLYSSSCFATGWYWQGKQDELKNSTIVEVGEIEKITPPVGTKWNKELYKLNSRCLAFRGYTKPSLYSSKPAMLVVNDSNEVKLAILEVYISEIKLDMYSMDVYKCPYGVKPEEYVDLLKKQIEQQQKSFQEQLKEYEKLKKAWQNK